MAEDEGRNLVVLLEDLLSAFEIRRFRIEIWTPTTARREMKTNQRSLQITENDRCGHAEQHKEGTIDSNDHLQDIVDDSQSAHQRIVEENVVVENAKNS